MTTCSWCWFMFVCEVFANTVIAEGDEFIYHNCAIQRMEIDITHILLAILSTKIKGRIDLENICHN